MKPKWTVTRTYKPSGRHMPECRSCGRPIGSDERYALHINRRNQVACTHTDCEKPKGWRS